MQNLHTLFLQRRKILYVISILFRVGAKCKEKCLSIF
jgi:hypothetical protein